MPDTAAGGKRQPSGGATSLHCYRCKSASATDSEGGIVEVPVFRREPEAEVLKDQVEFAGKEAAQLQAAHRDVSFLADMIVAGGAHDLPLGNVLPRFLEHDLSATMRVRVTGALIASGRIGSEEGTLRVKDVENEPPLVPKVALHATEKRARLCFERTAAY